MDVAMVRRAAPMVYAIVVVVVWLTLQGTMAALVTVVGAMLLGLMYLVTGPRVASDRRRGRNRGR